MSRAAGQHPNHSRATVGGLCAERLSDASEILSGGIAGVTWATFWVTDSRLIPRLVKICEFVARPRGRVGGCMIQTGNLG